MKELNERNVKIINEKLAELIKEKRIAKNMSQQAVADLAGVSRQSYFSWEKGCKIPFAYLYILIKSNFITYEDIEYKLYKKN